MTACRTLMAKQVTVATQVLMACGHHHCNFDVNPMWVWLRFFTKAATGTCIASSLGLNYFFTYQSHSITAAINLSNIDKHDNHQSHNIRLWFLANCVLHVLSRFCCHKHCVGWTFEWFRNFNNDILTCQRLL